MFPHGSSFKGINGSYACRMGFAREDLGMGVKVGNGVYTYPFFSFFKMLSPSVFCNAAEVRVACAPHLKHDKAP